MNSRRIIHKYLLNPYNRVKRLAEQRRNRTKTAEEVFTAIYQKNRWGAKGGEFCSGAGTTDEQVVSAYISKIAAVASNEGFRGLAFVDLGCGDFRVGKRLLPLCSAYIGVDVVKPLIQHNQNKYGNGTTQFRHLDIIDEELPDGDVCFLRQVLQHLSNHQIATVLHKIKKYRWVIITEHYPVASRNGISPNIDKVHGADVRMHYNSAVFLTEPPFNVPAEKLQPLLEVVGPKLNEVTHPGVIRTFLYKP